MFATTSRVEQAATGVHPVGAETGKTGKARSGGHCRTAGTRGQKAKGRPTRKGQEK